MRQLLFVYTSREHEWTNQFKLKLKQILKLSTHLLTALIKVNKEFCFLKSVATPSRWVFILLSFSLGSHTLILHSREFQLLR